MTDDDNDLDELFAPLREIARDPVDHPIPEELEAFHAKELPPEEEERIREHLVACRECADLVLDLQAFSVAAREPGTGVADFEQAAAWRDLREKLPFRPGTLEEPVKTEPRRRRALWSARGIAAVLAVAAVSGVLVYRLWEPGTREVTTLDPVGSVRGPEERAIVRLSSDIALGLRSGESYPEYRAEIRRDGQLIETLSDLRKDSPSEVFLKEPGSSLEPGDYEIVLLGLQNGLEDELARYEVRFVDP